MIVGATDALTAHGAFFSQAEPQRRPGQRLVLARLDHQADAELRDAGIVARARQQHTEFCKAIPKNTYHLCIIYESLSNIYIYIW